MSSSHVAPSVATLDLTAHAVATIDAIVADIASVADSSSSEAVLTLAASRGPSLPAELLSAFDRLAAGQHEPGLVIRGLRVNDLAIGSTPSHWRNCQPLTTGSPTFREELTLVLMGEALGEVFGYASLQDGRLLHNVMPIAGAETDQSGHGSRATLDWHTEDAFTPFRADFLALLGLRNLDAVATTFAGIEAVAGLDAADLRVLSEPRFAIVPDDEHLRATSPPAERSVLGDLADPRHIPVLHNGPRGLEMVIDSVYMSPTDSAGAAAYQRATAALDGALERVPILPGELLLVDNSRAVHGRDDFPARYDGTDRWLLKASIASHLQASASHRATATSRTLL